MTSTPIKKSAGGRPPKFAEGRRPITLTLPDRILALLAQVHADRARAIVKCVEAVMEGKADDKNAVQLLEVLPGKALIVIQAGHALLQKIDWLRVVEIAPSRHLLVLPPGMPIERLEVELRDLRESLDAGQSRELRMLEQLQSTLIEQRRKQTLSKGELLFVDISQ